MGILIFIIIPFILNVLGYRFFSRYKKIEGTWNQWETIPASTTVGHILYSALLALLSYLGTVVFICLYCMIELSHEYDHPVNKGTDKIIEKLKDILNTKVK